MPSFTESEANSVAAKRDQKQEQLLLQKMFLMLDNKRKVTPSPLWALITVYLACEGRESGGQRCDSRKDSRVTPGSPAWAGQAPLPVEPARGPGTIRPLNTLLLTPAKCEEIRALFQKETLRSYMNLFHRVLPPPFRR